MGVFLGQHVVPLFFVYSFASEILNIYILYIYKLYINFIYVYTHTHTHCILFLQEIDRLTPSIVGICFNHKFSFVFPMNMV